MVELSEIITIVVATLAALGEWIHWRRILSVKRLVFGPSEKPMLWVKAVPLLRVLALSCACWGFCNLCFAVEAQVHNKQGIPESEMKHLVLVVDVSPSMHLKDAGPEGKISRRQRASNLLESLFSRVPMRQFKLSFIAVYTDAKPLLEDSRVTAQGLYIEGFGDVRMIEQLACKARELGKGIVALKAGRSDQSREAMMSHTSSLSGSDAASDALLKRLAIARVESLPTLLETLKLLHVVGPLSGNHLASMSCSGGEAGLMADSAIGRDVVFPELNSAQREGLRSALGPIGVILGVWVVGGSMMDLWMRTVRGTFSDRMQRLRRLPRADWGKFTAHAGMGITVFAVAALIAWEDEDIRVAQVGDRWQVGIHEIEMTGVRNIEGANYFGEGADMTIYRNGREIGHVFPEKRIYPVAQMPTTEAGIRNGVLRDVYITLGDPQDGGGWAVRSYIKPFANWIWGGAILMALGGLISLSDRRLRVAAGAGKAQEKTVAAE